MKKEKNCTVARVLCARIFLAFQEKFLSLALTTQFPFVGKIRKKIAINAKRSRDTWILLEILRTVETLGGFQKDHVTPFRSNFAFDRVFRLA